MSQPVAVQAADAAMPGGANRALILTCLFGAFVFVQFTVLGLANHAGEGFLSTEQRTLVYYVLQVFVILGFLLYSLYFRFCAGKRIGRTVAYGAFGVFFACAVALLAVGRDSLGYVAISMAAALCVGGIGGAAHHRMSLATVTGGDVARCMGLGSAAAVVAQYLLQIQWGATPALPVFLMAAMALLLFLLRRVAVEVGAGDEVAQSNAAASEAGVVSPETGGASSNLDVRSRAASVENGKAQPTSSGRIAVSILITVTFILFVSFYNEYIHHLMIQSDYASYSVYSWPRLMLVPGYLLFAAIGDRKGGRYVSLASLCIMLIALLNVVLVGDQGTYWLNMCLFYFAIAAFTSYYLLTFWRLAPGTRHPALWAPFGRMLDSGMVLLTGAIGLSALPVPVILGMDIAGVALVIVLMAIGGDFNLADKTEQAEQLPIQLPVPSLEERVVLVARECGLTEREGEVLAALVLTEDKNQLIADKLGISRRQLQTHIARIYEKTGVTTRAGLIVRANGEQPR